ncbi:MAG: TIR domain-containing protein [Planctomycetaceae bacterium]|jgi:hypothetical protein|nr:TIR domain-containing protein [Planctomycetaceae bacterium]MDG2389532.1 TIR domain-containing protein [Planctomycetaceae bacterium]
MTSATPKQRIHCPQCQKQYTIPESNKRPAAVCKKCGTKFALPVASSPSPPATVRDDKQVFISYSSKDEGTANQVLEALEARGVSCWMAPRDIVAGSDWGASIIQGIESTETMLLLFSENSNLSKQVLREVERAVSKSNPIIPFRIDDCQMSQSFEYFLSSTHWFDASKPPLQERVDELLPLLPEYLKKEPGKSKSPSASKSEAKVSPVAATSSEKPAGSRFRRFVFRLKVCLFLCLLAGIAYAYVRIQHPMLAQRMQALVGGGTSIDEIREGGGDGEPIESWSVLRTLSGHSDSVNTGQFDLLNRQFLSGSSDDTMKLWDLTTGECVTTFRHPEETDLSYTQFLDIAVAPTRKLIFSAHDDRMIAVWDWETGDFVNQIRLERSAKAIAISPDESLLAIGDYSHVMLWDLEAEELRQLPEEHNQIRQLVSVDRTGAIRILEISTGEARRTIKATKSYQELCFAISPDGRKYCRGWLQIVGDLEFGRWDRNAPVDQPANGAGGVSQV